MSMANPWIRKAEGGPLDDVDWSQMNKPFGAVAPVDVPMSTRIGDEAQEGLTKAGMNPFAAEHLRQGFGSILDWSPLPAAIDTVDAQARGNKWDALKGMTRMIPGAGKLAGRAAKTFLPQMEEEIPSLLARSGETGLARKNSSSVAPPLTQALPDQVSTRAAPLGSSTTRPTTPLPTTEGPKPTFGDLELGSIDESSNKRVLQGSDDYKALLAAAERNKPRLVSALHEAIDGVPGARLYGVRVKDAPGLREKIESKGRAPSTISDYIGGRITVDTPQAMNELIERFGSTGRVIESENFIHSPKEGYRAYHLQLALGDGTSAEVQLVPAPIAKIMEEAHAIRQPFKRMAETSAEGYAKFKAAMTKANKLSDNAWTSSPAWSKTTQADISNLPSGESMMSGFAAGGGVQGDDNPYAQFDPKPAPEANPYAQFDPKPGAGGPMGWGDVAGQAIANAPQSALNFAKDTVHPILHPIDTLEGIGNLALGSMQKAGLYGGDSYKQYPEALGKFFVDRYGSIENAKKTLATDPVGALSDASVLLTGGGSAAERLPGMLGKTGEIMSKAGRMTDPILAPVTAARAGTKAVGEMLTHTGAPSLENAYKAGVEGNEAGETFRQHMRGNAPLEEPVEIARQGLEQFRRQRGQEYRADMNELRMSDTQFAAEDRILDFGKIDKAVDKAMGVQTFKGKVLDPGADAVRSDMIKAIADWKKEPPATFHTAEGIDALKRKLGNMMMDTAPNTSARKASGDIYNAVRKTITDYYPEYAKTMKSYEQASNLIKDIESSLSLGKRANVDTSLRKLQSIMRNNVNTNYGRRLDLGKLLEENGATHLMAALSGQSLNAWFPRGLGKLAAEATGVGAVLKPKVALALPFMSPRLMGEAAHKAGQLVGRPLAKSNEALGNVGLSNRALGNLSYRLGRTSNPYANRTDVWQ